MHLFDLFSFAEPLLDVEDHSFSTLGLAVVKGSLQCIEHEVCSEGNTLPPTHNPSGIVPIQWFDKFAFIGRDAMQVTGIDFVAPNPLIECLRQAGNIWCYQINRCPKGWIFATVLMNHPNCSLTDFCVHYGAGMQAT